MENQKITCPVCGNPKTAGQMIPGAMVRPGIAALIKADHPEWDENQPICQEDVARYRGAYLENLLQKDRGELNRLDRQVLDSIREEELLASNLEKERDEKLSLGERLADKIAEFGGSWAFILTFLTIMAAWILANIYLMSRPFDPYPFILLNLVLSCLAALQAPVIMMSQNRQETKDRQRVEQDYRTDLKAELEVRALHEKLDHLIIQQWERLLEIQRLQVEMMEELGKRKG